MPGVLDWDLDLQHELMRFGGLCLAEGFCEPVAASQSPDHDLGLDFGRFRDDFLNIKLFESLAG